MRFESRELKSYAEPVASNDLEAGAVYFALNFVDEEMLVPTLTTVVFAGHDLDEGDVDKVYFQDIDSYLEGRRFDDKVQDDTPVVFYSGSKREINHIFEYENALDQLLACSLRRQRAGVSRSRADE